MIKLTSLLIFVGILLAVVFLQAQELKNVKVLPFKTKKEIMPFMKNEVAKFLGVRCSYCHNLNDYASDEKAHKVIAREMMKMMQNINKENLDPLHYDPLTCWTCHRGSTFPERDSSGKKKKGSHKHG